MATSVVTKWDTTGVEVAAINVVVKKQKQPRSARKTRMMYMTTVPGTTEEVVINTVMKNSSSNIRDGSKSEVEVFGELQ